MKYYYYLAIEKHAFNIAIPMWDFLQNFMYMYVYRDILQFSQSAISQNYSMAVNQYCDKKSF